VFGKKTPKKTRGQNCQKHQEENLQNKGGRGTSNGNVKKNCHIILKKKRKHLKKKNNKGRNWGGKTQTGEKHLQKKAEACLGG